MRQPFQRQLVEGIHKTHGPILANLPPGEKEQYTPCRILEGSLFLIQMKHAVVLTLILGLAACGGSDKQPAEASENQFPPSQPKPNPKPTPKVAPVEATLTPGMEAAQQALDAGNYAEAIRLYTAELAAEEAMPTPSWVKLSFLYNQLGEALLFAAQYDKALENHRKALAIYLKQLGPGHTDVATSYNNNGEVHRAKGEYDKGLVNFRKALAIQLKQLGPGHPLVATSYNNMALVYYAKKDLAKAKEYWEKDYAICLKKLGPNHPNTKAQLDLLNK